MAGAVAIVVTLIASTALATIRLTGDSDRHHERDEVAAVPNASESDRRLGLHVSAPELEEWRRRAQRGPYRTAGDVMPNSPGDWERIVAMKERFESDPRHYVWQGPTFRPDEPIAHGPDWPSDLRGAPGKWYQPGAAEPIRDAAFFAMVLGSPEVPGAKLAASARDELLHGVRAVLLEIARSPANDYGNTDRYSRVGSGRFHPSFQMARWLVILTFAYDYAQVADASVWSEGEKLEFIRWLGEAADWMIPQIEARREGMFHSDGSPTAAAERPNAPPIWSGGPRAQKVHTRIDNHVPRMVQVPVLAGLLTELEASRSGIRAWSESRSTDLVALGPRSVRDYLVAELLPRVSGAGGGLASGGGNFYRGDDDSPLDGWKYAVEHLGRNLLIADHLARAGDTSAYEHATTAGTALSAGELPDDDVTGGGPKTLIGATRQLLRYIDEDSGPPRYACRRCTDETHRIDSRDEVNGIFRANEWEVLHANVYFRDGYVKDIYMRSLPGTPELPADPEDAQGWIENGSDGAYPGVNFMFAQMEGKVWPYELR